MLPHPRACMISTRPSSLSIQREKKIPKASLLANFPLKLWVTFCGRLTGTQKAAAKMRRRLETTGCGELLKALGWLGGDLS